MSKFNFYDRFSVTTTDFADFKRSWDFKSAGVLLLNESSTTSDIIQYSFDGSTLHGELRPNTPAAGLAFDNRTESSLYFRLATAGSGVVVRIEAWGI